MPGRVLLGAALWTFAVVVAFVTYGSIHQGTDTMRFWFGLVTTFTIPAVVMSPLMVFLHVGQKWWEVLAYVAFGVPSVGPMLLLVWVTRPRATTQAPAS